MTPTQAVLIDLADNDGGHEETVAKRLGRDFSDVRRACGALAKEDYIWRRGDDAGPWQVLPEGHAEVREMRPPRVVHVTELAHQSVANSPDLPRLVNDFGKRRRWVGIGWVDEGPALGSEPVQVNRFCLNAHPLHGLCDNVYGHKGKHGCDSPHAPRGKRYKKKARWTSAEGAEVSAAEAISWNERCRKGIHAGGARG